MKTSRCRIDSNCAYYPGGRIRRRWARCSVLIAPSQNVYARYPSQNVQPPLLEWTECTCEQYKECERYVRARILERLDRWRAENMRGDNVRVAKDQSSTRPSRPLSLKKSSLSAEKAGIIICVARQATKCKTQKRGSAGARGLPRCKLI